MSEAKVTINKKEYILSPLKMKYLKQISTILSAGVATTGGVYSSFERWMPFIVASISENAPEFTNEMMDEMTVQEYTDTWTKLLQISGIQVTNKGEAKPADLISKPSTDVSATQSAGAIAQ